MGILKEYIPDMRLASKEALERTLGKLEVIPAEKFHAVKKGVGMYSNLPSAPDLDVLEAKVDTPKRVYVDPDSLGAPIEGNNCPPGHNTSKWPEGVVHDMTPDEVRKEWDNQTNVAYAVFRDYGEPWVIRSLTDKEEIVRRGLPAYAGFYTWSNRSDVRQALADMWLTGPIAWRLAPLAVAWDQLDSIQNAGRARIPPRFVPWFQMPKPIRMPPLE